MRAGTSGTSRSARVFDPPPKARLFRTRNTPAARVQVVGQQQVTQLARSQSGQHQRQEQRELLLVARLQEPPFLVGREQHDRL